MVEEGTRYCTLTAWCYRGDFTQNQACELALKEQGFSQTELGRREGDLYPATFISCAVLWVYDKDMIKIVHRRLGFYSYRILELINHVLLFGTVIYKK